MAEDVYVLGQMRCTSCGAAYLSVWPSDADTLAFECVGCGAMASTCTVGHPLAEHRAIEELVAFHNARRALRLPALLGAALN